VSFAHGEQQVTLHGYAQHAVSVRALEGSVRDVTYDSISHLFSFQLAPGHSGSASFILR
jgi:hypothetical protein